MTRDRELIGQYVEQGSEAAFAELVHRHADLVYATALRLVLGESQLAEDVTQSVFIDLARKSRALKSVRSLAAWLHTATRFAAIEAIRRDQRRRSREQNAVVMNDTPTESQLDWQALQPVLDNALGRLKEPDREAVLLRFFEGKSLQEVGDELGISENAARMRVQRALEKLREALVRDGLPSSVSVLAAVLAGQPISAAPPGLVSTLTAAALTAGTASSVSGLATTVLPIITMTSFKLGIAGAALIVAMGTPLFIQQRTISDLRQMNVNLRERLAKNDELQARSARLAEQQAADADELSRLRAENGELMRLRGQISSLRRQVAESRAVPPKTAVTQANSEPDQKQNFRPAQDPTEQFARMHPWAEAVIAFAERNQGRLPERLSDAQPFLPPGSGLDSSTAEFEPVLIPGDMSAAPDPGQTIILRQIEPDIRSDGKLSKSYVFADGHAQIRFSQTNDFAAYEQAWPTMKKASAIRNVIGRSADLAPANPGKP